MLEPRVSVNTLSGCNWNKSEESGDEADSGAGENSSCQRDESKESSSEEEENHRCVFGRYLKWRGKRNHEEESRGRRRQGFVTNEINFSGVCSQ